MQVKNSCWELTISKLCDNQQTLVTAHLPNSWNLSRFWNHSTWTYWAKRDCLCYQWVGSSWCWECFKKKIDLTERKRILFMVLCCSEEAVKITDENLKLIAASLRYWATTTDVTIPFVKALCIVLCYYTHIQTSYKAYKRGQLSLPHLWGVQKGWKHCIHSLSGSVSTLMPSPLICF